MCGASLAVRYDPALARRGPSIHDEDRTQAVCEMPLRWLFYTCSDTTARHTIAAAHLRGYECRVAARGQPASIQLTNGVLLATWRDDGNELHDREKDLARLLHTEPKALVAHAWDFTSKDAVWDAFVNAPVPVVTSTAYCEVDGKKIPLPTTGEPLVPSTSRVRCVSKGKTITDLTPGPGGYSGFSTVMEGEAVVYRNWRNGYVDGESWRRVGKHVVRRSTYLNDTEVATSDFSPKDGALRRRSLVSTKPSRLSIEEDGSVSELVCGDTAKSDAIFADYCGYDRPRSVTVHDHDGTRTYTYDKGQITSVKDGP